jgi:hypothetical protein
MKHTAANTHTLAVIKKIFNGKIYKKSLALYNSEGEGAVLDFLQQFVTCDIRLVLLQTWS